MYPEGYCLFSRLSVYVPPPLLSFLSLLLLLRIRSGLVALTDVLLDILEENASILAGPWDGLEIFDRDVCLLCLVVCRVRDVDLVSIIFVRRDKGLDILEENTTILASASDVGDVDAVFVGEGECGGRDQQLLLGWLLHQLLDVGESELAVLSGSLPIRDDVGLRGEFLSLLRSELAGTLRILWDHFLGEQLLLS